MIQSKMKNKGAKKPKFIENNVTAGTVSPGKVAPRIENFGIKVIDGHPTAQTIDDAKACAEL